MLLGTLIFFHAKLPPPPKKKRVERTPSPAGVDFPLVTLVQISLPAWEEMGFFGCPTPNLWGFEQLCFIILPWGLQGGAPSGPLLAARCSQHLLFISGSWDNCHLL